METDDPRPDGLPPNEHTRRHGQVSCRPVHGQACPRSRIQPPREFVPGRKERRFGVDLDWASPGLRFRDVVESIRHIWAVFQDREDELAHAGAVYGK